MQIAKIINQVKQVISEVALKTDGIQGNSLFSYIINESNIPILSKPKIKQEYEITPYMTSLINEPGTINVNDLISFLNNTPKGEDIQPQFLKTPKNTALFFGDLHIPISTLKNINFYSKYMLGNDNFTKNAQNNTSRTRDMQKIIAKEYGKITVGEFFPSGVDDGKSAWDKISELFAQRCSGEVLVVLGDLPQSEFEFKIWEKYEKSALLNNSNITMIIEIKPEELEKPARIVFPNGIPDEFPFKVEIKPELSGLIESTKMIVLDFGITKYEHSYELEGKTTVVLNNTQFKLLKKDDLEIISPDGFDDQPSPPGEASDHVTHQPPPSDHVAYQPIQKVKQYNFNWTEAQKYRPKVPFKQILQTEQNEKNQKVTNSKKWRG